MCKIAYLGQRKCFLKVKALLLNIDNDNFFYFIWYWVQSSTGIRKERHFFFFFCHPASYKKIDTRILQVPGTDEVELTCQAEGYPLAEVSWPNISFSANTSHIETADGLYRVTSILRLKLLPGRNFTCEFWNADVKELTSAIIDPQGKSSCPS